MKTNYLANQAQFHLYVNGMDEKLFRVRQFQSKNLMLNQPYQFDILLLASETLFAQNILGKLAKLVIDWNQDSICYHGYIEVWECLTKTGNNGDNSYQVTLTSPITKLHHSKQSRTFVNQSVSDITQTIIKEAGFLKNHYRLHLTSRYPTIPMLIQYNETNLEFLHHLFNEYGLFYYFEQDTNTWRWVISDNNHELPKFSGHSLLFEPQSGQASNEERIYHFMSHHTSLPTDNFIIKTDCRGLQVGQFFQLKNYPIEENNTFYRVIAMEIKANQSENESLYTHDAKCFLIFAHQPYPQRIEKNGQFTGLLPAFIASENNNDEYPNLDDKGLYLVNMPFDKENSPHSKRLPLLQTTGKHFPLKAGTEVLMALNHDQRQDPIIMGPINNSIHQTTVNQKNRNLHVLRTFGGNEISLSDDKNAEYALLATQNHFNYLKFDNQKDKQKITISSKKGKLEFYSGRDIFYNIGNSQIYSAKENYHINVKEQQSLETKNKSILHQADKKVIYSSKQNHYLQSQENNFNVSINKDLTLKSQLNQHIKIQNGNFTCKNETGKITLLSKQACLIKNHPSFPMSFTQALCNMNIMNGNMNVKALQVDLEARELNIHLPIGNVVKPTC